MDHPTSADSRLSNYRLERLLGSGGMGSVYLARDLALDRLVAIKFIASDKAGDDSARRRLLREARAAASLEHPNICGVYEVIDAADGRACIVMQYVEGRTLADVLRDGPLDVRLALTLAGDLASALAVAHRHGIIHRDLKPQNVILTEQHRAKLLDFGVARHTGTSTIAGDGTTTTQLTTPGVLVGTPAYMSPEQARQRPLDGRSDLFALGAVVFECLTGRRPFEGRSGLEQVSEVLHRDPPPVSSLRSGLTEQHDEFVRRLLAKAPEDRFQSAEEVLGALRVLIPEDWSSRWTTHQRHERSWLDLWRRRRVAYAAAAILVIVAAAGVWRWSRPTPTFEGTPQAKDLYLVGTEWIRRGAYSSARRALSESVRISPGYVPAYVRLAEAAGELDDHVAARDALLNVNQFVADVDLPPDDRFRVQAVRAIVWRKWDDAIAAYDTLAKRNPDDPGALLDLGRVQEAAALIVPARETYERAIEQRPDYAAAHLRLAGVLADQNHAAALQSFEKAEQLFETETNFDGQIEAMLQRGAFLNARGELLAARKALERALDLATGLNNREQRIRARLELSSVTASEGRFKEAQSMATEAAKEAEDADLDTVAANGLIDLANAILYKQHSDAQDGQRRAAVEGHLHRAIELADKREARRTRVRAQLQLAAAKSHWDDPQAAFTLAEEQLSFLRETGHRRYELTALTIMSRCLEALGEYSRARELAEQVLAIATRNGNQAQRAEALDNLAGQSAAMGMLPAAEQFWRESAEARRAQNDSASLPYDLTNRAEMLIRLGQTSEADALLREVEQQALKKIEAYSGRMRRVGVLRALAEAIHNRPRETASHARRVLEQSAGITDGSARLAEALLAYAQAVTREKPVPADRPWMDEQLARSTDTEALFWEVAARHESGDFEGILTRVLTLLSWKTVSTSHELEWRVAAVGAAAARALKDDAEARSLSDRAQQRLTQLGRSWPDSFEEYLRRPDLQELLRKAGIAWRQ